jgi:hypothetical protein
MIRAGAPVILRFLIADRGVIGNDSGKLFCKIFVMQQSAGLANPPQIEVAPALCGLKSLRNSEQSSLIHFTTPRCAIPILSLVLFFTIYIISSAWRMMSCGDLASCG